MFTTLIESKGRRKAHTRWLPASAVIHLLLFAGAIAYSPPAHGSRVRSPETPGLVWVAPQPSTVTTRRAGAGGGERTAPTATERPLPAFGEGIVVDVPDVTPAALDGDGNGPVVATISVGRPGETGLSSGPGGPAWAWQVEKVALPHPANRPPQYPQILHAASIEGSVTMRFVIDTTGAVEAESRVVVRTDHPLFTAAVLRALGSHRFLPAEAGGTKVRMLVEQRFEFSMSAR